MPVFVLDPAERRRLLDRFLRYVRVDTRSDADSEASPSTEKQKDLARLLVDELKALGCDDARMDEWGYVFATVPANLPADHPAHGKVPAIGLIAHLDTYHGVSGTDVKPQVHEDYDGADLVLPATGERITAEGNPNLAHCKGHTVITADGTTLLGADDKAGIAEIMTVVDWLKHHPEQLHGELKVAFTTDEEVGRGTEHFDVEAFGARYAYTLDGSDLGEIEDETFCADTAIVKIVAHDVHPGYAKNRMVSALRVGAAIIDGLPEAHLPETTEGRESFLHPIQWTGEVADGELKLLVRAFTVEELELRQQDLQDVVAKVQQRFPGAKISVEFKPSYRNMGYEISKDPAVLEVAMDAARRQEVEPLRRAIRGGTDGAQLSFKGLLTPNVWAGGQNFHSTHEWVSLDWMAKAAETSLQILQVWVERGAAAADAEPQRHCG